MSEDKNLPKKNIPKPKYSRKKNIEKDTNPADSISDGKLIQSTIDSIYNPAVSINTIVGDSFLKSSMDSLNKAEDMAHNLTFGASNAASIAMGLKDNSLKSIIGKTQFLGLTESYQNSLIASASTIDAQKRISTYLKWSPLVGSKMTSELKHETEIAELKIKFSNTLNDYKKDSKSKEQKIQELNELHDALEAKEKISHVLSRVNEEARKKLLQSPDFLNGFNNSQNCEAVVVSIDIRRSTELMLKAKTPELFSKFITELSSKLSTIIIENYGIFDKFTGDGILAFFPKFFSGDQAILRALKAAEECHEIFEKHYNSNKKGFSVFITNIGLGIGIDYGNVTLVNTSNELTVVGIPVVYACRMSSAKAGDTVLNIPAFEELENIYGSQELNYDEVLIEIKNEGSAQAYKVESKNNKGLFNPIKEPKWLKEKIEVELEETIEEKIDVSENHSKEKNVKESPVA